MVHHTQPAVPTAVPGRVVLEQFLDWASYWDTGISKDWRLAWQEEDLSNWTSNAHNVDSNPFNLT